MSSCHAFWSLGGLCGAATGGFLIAALGVLGHVLLLAAVCLVLFLVARPMILADAPHATDEPAKAKLPMTPLPWLIGTIALFCMIPEGTVLDWSALYLRNELNASTEMSGFAFAAFSFTMAVCRFAGDFVRDRFGAVNTLRFCGVAAIIGLVIAGQSGDVTLALVGFAITGIGISNMVPIAFSAGGNIPGLAPGVGLSVVTTMGYSGILAAPSLIGFVGERTGFSPVFVGIALLLVLATQVTTGLFSVDVDGLESGPLAIWVSFDTGRQLAEIHEFNFNILAGLIGLHIMAIATYHFLLGEKLVGPMITGRRTRADFSDTELSEARIRPLPMIVALMIALICVWGISTFG